MHIIERSLSRTLNATETIFIRPEHIDATFRIDVTRCGMAAKGEWHGIINLDGDITNGALHSVCTMLAPAEIPSTIAVSVSFTDLAAYRHVLARNTHLTPDYWPEFDRTYCKLNGSLTAPPTGKAEVFRDFLATELQPFIEEEFGVDPSKWTLTGISFGGLFTLYTMFTRPNQFARYNAVSASAWFKKPNLYELAEKFAKETDPIAIRAYLSVGDHEDGQRNDLRKRAAYELPDFKPVIEEMLEIIDGSPDQVAETTELGRILKQRVGCVSKAVVMPNETHSSVYMVSLSQGLRWLHCSAT